MLGIVFSPLLKRIPDTKIARILLRGFLNMWSNTEIYLLTVGLLHLSISRPGTCHRDALFANHAPSQPLEL